jgi:AcrR family transcriptional regulator
MIIFELMLAREDRRKHRGEETRQRLLECGSRVFAELGFEATTTRRLAEAAGVNQAAILYHFGGKEGLYVAVAEEIATRGREAMAAYLSSVPAPIGALSPREARLALGSLLRGLLRGFVTIAGDGSAAAFIVREQANPGAAFDRLYSAYIQPVHAHVTALVAAARKRSETDVDAVLTAHAIIGMALVFVTARETALRRTKWRAYTAERLEHIAELVVALADGAIESHAR